MSYNFTARAVAPNPKCNGCHHFESNRTACMVDLVPTTCGDGSEPELGYAPIDGRPPQGAFQFGPVSTGSVQVFAGPDPNASLGQMPTHVLGDELAALEAITTAIARQVVQKAENACPFHSARWTQGQINPHLAPQISRGCECEYEVTDSMLKAAHAQLAPRMRVVLDDLDDLSEAIMEKALKGPGARGGKWYRTKAGKVKYGNQPSGKARTASATTNTPLKQAPPKVWLVHYRSALGAAEARASGDAYSGDIHEVTATSEKEAKKKFLASFDEGPVEVGDIEETFEPTQPEPTPPPKTKTSLGQSGVGQFLVQNYGATEGGGGPIRVSRNKRNRVVVSVGSDFQNMLMLTPSVKGWVVGTNTGVGKVGKKIITDAEAVQALEKIFSGKKLRKALQGPGVRGGQWHRTKTGKVQYGAAPAPKVTGANRPFTPHKHPRHPVSSFGSKPSSPVRSVSSQEEANQLVGKHFGHLSAKDHAVAARNHHKKARAHEQAWHEAKRSGDKEKEEHHRKRMEHYDFMSSAHDERMDAEHESSVEKAVLTARGRKKIKKKNFALPGGRYPIHDAAHARNALARVAQHGSPSEQARVRAAVRRKYKNIGKALLDGDDDDARGEGGGYGGDF